MCFTEDIARLFKLVSPVGGWHFFITLLGFDSFLALTQIVNQRLIDDLTLFDRTHREFQRLG